MVVRRRRAFYAVAHVILAATTGAWVVKLTATCGNAKAGRDCPVPRLRCSCVSPVKILSSFRHGGRGGIVPQRIGRRCQMNVRLLVQMSLALGALSLSAAEVDRAVKTDAPLVAHEWGTFTSVANPEGNPVGWAPAARALRPDLPVLRCIGRVAGDRLQKAEHSGLRPHGDAGLIFLFAEAADAFASMWIFRSA